MTTQLSAQNRAFQAIVVPLGLAALGVYTIVTALPGFETGQIVSGSGLLVLALFALLTGMLPPSPQQRKPSPLRVTLVVAGLFLVVAGVVLEQFPRL